MFLDILYNTALVCSRQYNSWHGPNSLQRLLRSYPRRRRYSRRSRHLQLRTSLPPTPSSPRSSFIHNSIHCCWQFQIRKWRNYFGRKTQSRRRLRSVKRKSSRVRAYPSRAVQTWIRCATTCDIDNYSRRCKRFASRISNSIFRNDFKALRSCTRKFNVWRYIPCTWLWQE